MSTGLAIQPEIKTRKISELEKIGNVISAERIMVA